ncbi:MAG TPA: phosphopantothenoylcysteine decarboxylase [Candidatus Glassbacteria bacterium]|nr:phosphopantothenoylcysteine decarboxylase [Candidatus Glassbacteria bacterium]
MKILVTAGAVHSYLDAVKIITNDFKGGRIAQLAQTLLQNNKDMEIIYLCKKGLCIPLLSSEYPSWDTAQKAKIIYHDGLEDYMNKVCKIAPEVDAVVCGAAVANIIPKNPWKGKFPSHNYKAGDVIPIDFVIAPRVIDEIKKVAPKTHVFGFKLLSGANHEELIRAAYEVLLGSKATTVFANDKNDLDTIYAVTKDRSVHPMDRSLIADWIVDCIKDEYYRTEIIDEIGPWHCSLDDMRQSVFLLNEWEKFFTECPEGFVFGSIAFRCKHGGFYTTERGKKFFVRDGKKTIGGVVWVKKVNHAKKVVYSNMYKSSLNAPLFAHIFRTNLNIKAIVHLHEKRQDLSTQAYALPGTVRDSQRENCSSSFNIEGHGCIILFDKDGKEI